MVEMSKVEEEEDLKTMEDRMKYLRSRGVEIDTVVDKTKADGKSYRVKFVKIPWDTSQPMTEESAELKEGNDGLKDFLGPRFSGSAELDEATVERETRTQISKMFASQNLEVPSTDAVRNVAKSMPSVAEAYPLSTPNPENTYIAVKIYIDEIGSLRQRPRNARAESIASECAGLDGISFHGDAYIGRLAASRHLDFGLNDLKPSAPWAIEARRQHTAAFHHIPDSAVQMRSGQYETYTWSQTNEDLEIRVKIPTETLDSAAGLALKKRIKLSLAKGDSLLLSLDKTTPLLSCPRLFNKVSVDDASWTLENGDLVIISLEKLEPQEWTCLHFDEDNHILSSTSSQKDDPNSF